MTHGTATIYDTGKVYFAYFVTVNGETTWYTNEQKYLERISHD